MTQQKIRKFSITILTLLLTLTIFPQTFTTTTQILPQSPLLTLTLNTDMKTYTIRQPITITGTILRDGNPADDVLIAIEIRNERNAPQYFRTIKIGNPPEMPSVEITGYYFKDTEGNPITKATPTSTIKFGVTIKNILLNPINPTIAITVIDETLTPIYASWTQTSIPAGTQSTPAWLIQIPEWTKPGKILIFINVYTKLPSQGGIPYIPETTIPFNIVRNSELQPTYTPTITTYTASIGNFELHLRASPDDEAWPGQYTIYSTARGSQTEITSTQTTYQYSSNDPSPPQAAFTYYPTIIYQNMTVTFDASSSSAEGFNDTIIRYEWKINDPNNPQHIIKEGNYANPPDPTITHIFEYPGTYTVELNVTDNEGLWSYTMKPVTVNPEFGPTANFTWSPEIPVVNGTVTFNASNCKPGWSAKLADYSPIVSYTWNFSDGTYITVTEPTITHNFTQPGNYTVTLTIEDSVGRTANTSKTIEVTELPPWDINKDKKVDVKDIFIVAKAYGSQPGDPNWDPRCDLNGDEKVDVKDVFIVAKHYGETY